MRIFIKNEDVFFKLTYDVGKLTQEFIIKLTGDAEQRKQQPSKFLSQYKDRPENLLKELQKAGIFREIGSDVEMSSFFTNDIIILSEGDTVKLVVDTRYLNSFLWFVKLLMASRTSTNVTV